MSVFKNFGTVQTGICGWCKDGPKPVMRNACLDCIEEGLELRGIEQRKQQDERAVVCRHGCGRIAVGDTGVCGTCLADPLLNRIYASCWICNKPVVGVPLPLPPHSRASHRECDKSNVLSGLTYSGYGTVIVEPCPQCQRLEPRWSLDSHVRCSRCRIADAKKQPDDSLALKERINELETYLRHARKIPDAILAILEGGKVS